MHAGQRGLLFDLPTVGDPVAVRQRRDDEATPPEVMVLHAIERNWVMRTSMCPDGGGPSPVGSARWCVVTGPVRPGTA